MAEKRTGDGTLSLISNETTIEGKLVTDGSLRIDSKVVGDVNAKAHVSVRLTGTVEGSITARNVAISGRMKGWIAAAEKLILEGKSIVRGDLKATKLVVDEGAVFDGHCVMSKPEAEHPRTGGHPAQ